MFNHKNKYNTSETRGRFTAPIIRSSFFVNQWRFGSGDVSSDAEFDKVIDGVAKAIANAEPYIANKGKNILFDYKGYRAVCCERNGELIFISGYKIERGGR